MIEPSFTNRVSALPHGQLAYLSTKDEHGVEQEGETRLDLYLTSNLRASWLVKNLAFLRGLAGSSTSRSLIDELAGPDFVFHGLISCNDEVKARYFYFLGLI